MILGTVFKAILVLKIGHNLGMHLAQSMSNCVKL
jgi:hypothetical protein